MNIFVMRNKKIFGPMDLEKVNELYSTGLLRRIDQVSESKTGPWKSIKELLDVHSTKKQSPQKRPGPVVSTAKSRPSLPVKQKSSSPLTSLKRRTPPPLGSRGPRPKPVTPDHKPPLSSPTVSEDAPSGETPPSKSTVAEQAYSIFETALHETRRAVDDTERITISDKLIIGRNAEHADWLVPDPSVSPRHAEIAIRNQSLYLRDLGSTTGTVLNNQTIGHGRNER